MTAVAIEETSSEQLPDPAVDPFDRIRKPYSDEELRFAARYFQQKLDRFLEAKAAREKVVAQGSSSAVVKKLEREMRGEALFMEFAFELLREQVYPQSPSQPSTHSSNQESA